MCEQVKLTPSVLELDLPEVEKRLRRFIKEYVENAGAEGIVLGMSGGIDSGTVAALSSISIGGALVTGLMLPEKETYNEFAPFNNRLIRRLNVYFLT